MTNTLPQGGPDAQRVFSAPRPAGAETGPSGVGLGGEEDVVRPFVVLDTLNHVAVWDDVDDAWPDQTALVQAALERWLGLTGPMCAWDWPCQVWTVRR